MILSVVSNSIHSSIHLLPLYPCLTPHLRFQRVLEYAKFRFFNYVYWEPSSANLIQFCTYALLYKPVKPRVYNPPFFFFAKLVCCHKNV